MVQASADHPGLGDMSAVRSFAADMRTRARELEGLADQVQQAAADVGAPNVLDGFAGLVWTGRAPVLRAAIGSIVNVLDARRKAADAYAQEVESIDSQAATVWDERGTALRNLQYWQQTPLEYRMSWEGQQREQQIQATLYWTRIRLDRLYSDRQRADSTFADALDNGVSVLGQSSSAISGVGARLTGAFGLTEIEVIEAVVATEELAANPRDEDALLRARSELADLGDDPEAWERFYRPGTGVSGETLTLAVASVGALWRHGTRDTSDSDVRAGIDTAVMLREGLATASADWSDYRADSFAESLFTGVENHDVQPSTVAFLFNNPEQVLMGSALTLAAATQIDRLERSQGRNFGPGIQPAHDAMRFLSHYANGEPDDLPASSSDVAAQVFRSLGQHPDAALEFLTGDGVAVEDSVATQDITPGRADRLEYWFGMRDWSADGHEAPLVLLEGMQHAEDGILDASTNLGSLTAAQLETITAQNQVLTSAFGQIAWSGYGEPGWQSDEMSDKADGLLLQTVENHHLLIGLSTVLTHGGGSSVEDGLLTVLENSDLALPHLELDKATLGQVLARVEDVDAARQSLADTGSAFTSSMGGLLSSGQVSPSSVMDATTGMWAFADGAAHGIAIENGQRADDQASLLVDFGAQTVKYGVGQIPVLGDFANSLVVEPSIDYVAGMVTEAVAGQEVVARDQAAWDGAIEATRRGAPDGLLQLYGEGDNRWLGDAYRDSNGNIDARKFEDHVRSVSTNAANNYSTAVTFWRDLVDRHDEANQDRSGS